MSRSTRVFAARMASETEPGVVRHTELLPERGVRGGHLCGDTADRDLFAPFPGLPAPCRVVLCRPAAEGSGLTRAYLARLAALAWPL
jgi:hypothetical protein